MDETHCGHDFKQIDLSVPEKAKGKGSGRRPYFKIFLTAWVFVENCLFSGLRAGWPSLVYILKQERVYGYLCQINITTQLDKRLDVGGQYMWLVNGQEMNNVSLNSLVQNESIKNFQSKGNSQMNLSLAMVNTGIKGQLEVALAADFFVCKEQDEVFNRCFAVATASMAFSALMFGHLNYKFGIRVPRLVSVIFFVSGAVFTAFITKDMSWMIFPGFLLTSSGGMALYLTNNQISYMYTTGSAAVIGLLTGGLQSSSFVQTVIKLLYEQGVSIKTSYLTLGALYLMIVVSTFCFLPKRFIENPSDEEGEMDLLHGVDAGQEQRLTTPESPGSVDTAVLKLSHDGASNAEQVETWKNVRDNKPGLQTLCQCLMSWTFMLYLFWSAVVLIVLAMALGTFNPWLEFITDNDKTKVSWSTDVLYYTMLCSPVLAVLAGVGMDILKQAHTQGHTQEVSAINRRMLFTSAVSLGVTSVLGIIVCLFIIVSDTRAIVWTCVALVLFRTGLYSCGTAFLRIMYPTHLFGILCGIMSVSGGVISFTQYPLFLWAQQGAKYWSQVYGLLTALSVLSLASPLYLFYKSRHV